MKIFSQYDWKEVKNRNLYATTELIKIHKSREEGESDLVKIARLDDVEAIWMYSSEHDLWYNCTYNTHVVGTQNNKPEITAILPAYLDVHEKRVDFYHTHPKSFTERNITEKLKEYSIANFKGVEGANNPKLNLKFLRVIAARFFYISSALLSLDDIEGFFEFQKAYPDVPISESVVSDYGILSYSLKNGQIKKEKEIFLNLEDFLENKFQIMESVSALNSKIGLITREGIQEGIINVAEILAHSIPQMEIHFTKIN